ncbi:hypothetical protein FF38_09941 [Lucilia cuprina]|uniref:DALR anticodon binding domain-containing protein n=1 Tax=Lucilia cuprina TaxID=7375 RepID=A0A0L0CBD6_LUCCU|nr:DALR anticodon-binding domain-containing protein 3 [Lucilia cuprina]KNC28779.1 hypothetical protein FF38_09941 [Lucilia cuprina]
MDNPLNNLLINIKSYFVPSSHEVEYENYRKMSTLIRIHSEKLQQSGDVSFPCKTEIWLNYFPDCSRKLNESAFQLAKVEDEVGEQEKSKFLEAAKEWLFPVAKLVVRQERIHLHLHRSVIVARLVPDVLTSDNYGQLQKVANKKVYLNQLLENCTQDDLSFYRNKLMHNVLQKLLQYSRWHQVDNKEENMENNSIINVQVQSVASKMVENNCVIIKCGLVTDPSNNGKRCLLSTKDYLSIRSNDMTLMALHKYGIRVKQDARFCALMERLGSAAATVDLLEVKHTSPVQIILNGQGSTKGASFILYNSARLETILRTFQERIEEGEYEPLPPIESIQWQLLIEEEEWQLVYAYLAGFPNLIDRCLEQLERGLCSTHLIIHFLHGLVAIFSVYYRRIRILTEKRDHLMPYVYARIYLIKAVREVLNKTLALLDIEPVEFM